MLRTRTPTGFLVGVFLCLLVACGESASTDFAAVAAADSASTNLILSAATESICAPLSSSARGGEPSAHEEPLADEEPSAHKEPLADEEPSAHKEPSAEPLVGATEWAELASVTDGDTLRLKDGRTVRVLSINAPELGRRGQAGEPFSRAATNAAKAFLEDSTRIRLVLGQEREDRYGRLLAHVYRSDGASLEEHLLAQGLAFHSPVPPNTARSDCYAALEHQARQARLGIWSDRGIHPTAARDVDSGGYQRIRGRVTSVSFRRNWWLELDDRFTVVIHPADQHRFDRQNVAAWESKTVEIQGWVYPVRGELRMKLETPWVIRTE